MKRFLSIVIGVFASVSAMAVNLNDNPSSYVLMSTFGGRDGVTMTNAIAKLGTRECALIYDGTWYCTNSVTFPSNMTVVVTPGSTFWTTNGTVLTFQGNSFVADDQPVFTGLGSATGSCYFIYRWPSWGDTGRFRIGDGIYVGVSPSLSGSTLVLTGDATVGGNANITSNLWANGSYFNTLTVSNWSRLLGYTYAPNMYVDNITVSNTSRFMGPSQFEGTTKVLNSGAASWNDLVLQDSTNIYFTTNNTYAQMQATLDGLKRRMNPGAYVTVYFASGTYILTNALHYSAVDGVFQIYGNTADAEYIAFINDNAVNHSDGSLNYWQQTNQTVILDGRTNPYGSCLNIDGGGTQIIVRNIHFKGAPASYNDGMVSIHTWNNQVYAYVQYNFFEGTSTNQQDLLTFSGLGGYECSHNAFSYGGAGIRAWLGGSDVLAYCNRTASGTTNQAPSYGQVARWGTIRFRGTQHVAGVTADVAKQNGGEAITNGAELATDNITLDLPW